MTDQQTNTPAELWLRQAQSMAAFTPSEGCWCTAFRVARGEEWFPVLAEPPSWDALRTRPTMVGNPLLFPYPYGVRDATFEYRDQVYHLRPGREGGRAMHGLVRDHPWAVERVWEDSDGAHLQASFHNEGDLLAEYPFPFALVTTHTLAGTALTYHWQVTNLGDGPMPMALGIHPYFGLPLFPEGRIGDLRLQSGAAYTRPVMRGESFSLATGVLDMRPGQPVDQYIQGAAPADRSLLVLYAQHDEEATAPTGAWSGANWRLSDMARGLEISIDTSGALGYVANFSPPSRAVLSPVISTCLPGALNLMGPGVRSGIIELEPGERWEAQARIAVRWSS
jgi:galactose mutarotase-like enzyme